jgi:hypothetical protein
LKCFSTLEGDSSGSGANGADARVLSWETDCSSQRLPLCKDERKHSWAPVFPSLI